MQACLPTSTATRRTIASTQKSTTTPSTTPTFSTLEEIYWFSSLNLNQSITLNKNNQSFYYLRGKNIHQFLSAQDAASKYQYSKQFCMLIQFKESTHRELRVRAIPTTVTQSNGAIERLFKIDFVNSDDNKGSLYNVSTQQYTGCYKTTSDNATLEASASYALKDICLSCSGMASLRNLKIYENKITASPLQLVSSNQLNLSALNFFVDLNSSTQTDQVSTCTNADCQAKGFGCCSNGQCVNDAEIRPLASSQPDYTQAMADYHKNPSSFINWPTVFYICNYPNSQNSSGQQNNKDQILLSEYKNASERVSAYTQKWKCLKEVEATSTYNQCITYQSSTSTVEKSNSRTLSAYEEIKYSLQVACGCKATFENREESCANWTIKPVYSNVNSSLITDFMCSIPSSSNNSGSITNLNVSVSSRMAPHRFYNLSGNSIDDLTTLTSLSTNDRTQEGDDFYYLDETNKIGPVSNDFNPNAILGRMTVDLTKTMPAKMVAVEYGRTYVISTFNGLFTPCPTCAPDSWYSSFFSHPKVSTITGLQGNFTTTDRENYSFNDSLSNYEDNHFGRACFIPMTMIPFSHKKEGNLRDQRLNRLKTQAALFMNGYQRDWFGFNKGALIGSFDGVQWFAIGNARRITATSSKLFLAINASFLDLSSRSDSVVNIIPDLANNMASNVDYDPTLALTDVTLNQAASCQKFHQCEKDSDCVSQLGWEYSCADVSLQKTTWPLFNSEAQELAQNERNYQTSILDILAGQISTAKTKRCLYRGAGAPCLRDLSNLDNAVIKAYSCAPNFYCAATTSNRFNSEVVRSPNELDAINFGFDREILGRPKHYVNASKALPLEVKNNLEYALNTSVNAGICRPGKSLATLPTTSALKNAHMNADTMKRTDYISQIGSCNSTLTGASRILSCPAIGTDGNLLNYKTDPSIYTLEQNMCGASAVQLSTGKSAFRSIEGLSLASNSVLSDKTLALDACLRKAGSICHTNLDCGPNRLHEEIAANSDLSFFGGTTAEKNFWTESLVCGQTEATPTKGSSSYLNYRLTDNRCCREIGKDFSMYTSGPVSIIQDMVDSGDQFLQTSRLTYANPKANYRYSRYEGALSGMNEAVADFDDKGIQFNSTIGNSLIPSITANSAPTPYQWRVVQETGKKTCCGGGWIRKFADGTHSWPIGNRFKLDATHFACLNYRSPLANSSLPSDSPNLFYSLDVNASSTRYLNLTSFQRESELLCRNPADGGCLQIPYPDSENYKITVPTLYNLPSGVASIDTSPLSDPKTTTWTQATNVNAPYQPVPYYYPNGIDVDTSNIAYNFFTSDTFDYGVSMYLPIYIGRDKVNIVAGTTSSSFISKVKIKYFFDPPLASPVEQDITNMRATDVQCASVANYSGPVQPVDNFGTSNAIWCLGTSNGASNRPLLIAKADTNVGGSFNGWKYAGVVIDFTPLEQAQGTNVTVPGNPRYYLSKLAKLELLGIPQITYEPLYCNNDNNKVVPGIFKSNLSTRAQFNALSTTLNYEPQSVYDEDDTTSDSEISGAGNHELKFTFQNNIDHSPIFSSKDFACCTPLGKTPKNGASSCCSGYATTANNQSKCALPSGTDLFVYFNKFVSSEGVGSDLPGGGLIADLILDSDGDGLNDLSSSDPTAIKNIDFNPITGEPKNRESTAQKLFALGVAFCANKEVVTGGAFGSFTMEPASGVLNTENFTNFTSIVDSAFDNVTNSDSSNAGKVPFDRGFRWNNHYYCK